MPLRSPSRAVRPTRADAAAVVVSSILILAAAQPAAALKLDFSSALQELENGTEVETVHLQGAWMAVAVENESSHLAIVFDSGDPDDYPELGTPNEDFDGPGKGDGGESGEDGENECALGNVLVIAANDSDADGNGILDHAAPDLDDGTLWLSFSHAGYLTFRLVNVDDDGTRIVAYRGAEEVGTACARELGRNSVQEIDLSGFGSVDRVAIDMDGVAAVAAIVLDVPVTGVQSATWTGVKRIYR